MRLDLVISAALVLVAGTARGQTFQVSVGGRAGPVGDGVICGEISGWELSPDQRAARPKPELRPGTISDARIAADALSCSYAAKAVSLVAMGPWPEIDPAGVTLFVDEGRLEIRGDRLEGVQFFWQAGERGGEDTCFEPTVAAGRQRCSIPVARGLPADAPLSLSWLPAGARRAAEVVTLDASGRTVSPRDFEIRPARIVLSNLLSPAAVLDITSGVGRVALSHPEAVIAADCGHARCEVNDGALQVRSVPGLVSSISVRLRLAPRMFVLRGDSLETSQTATVALLHCPVAVVSGPPVRDLESSRLVVRMDGRCGREAESLRWSLNGDSANVVRLQREAEALYAVLEVNRIEDDRFQLVATRPEPDAVVVATVSGKTMAPPQVRATLELPEHGKIDFVPTNRPALLRTVPVGEHGHLVALPIAGAYEVQEEHGSTFVRGDENAAGYVTLRFGYRVDTLPASLASTNLAVVFDPLQRAVREASVPAPIETSALGPEPLLELVCVGEDGEAHRVMPGRTFRIPFSERDSCRVVIHRERLRAQDGTQDVSFDVSITSLDGTVRPDSRVSERMILRPAKDSRVLWIKGVKGQFDRISVRVAHVIDESRFVGGSQPRNELPSVQWSVIVGEGRLRLYATTTIPTGLYRLTEPRGILTLNFGVLSRLTWLDDTGREGLIGLELGMMGVGLVKTVNFNFPPALATLGGLGIGIPLGNRGEVTQASVNLHIWSVYEFRGNLECTANAPCPRDNRFGFYFGPSISIGNVGTNL